MGVERGEERGPPRFEHEVLVNNGGERRDRGKREYIFTVGPWVEVRRHRSDR
jgi:hypothetical protein